MYRGKMGDDDGEGGERVDAVLLSGIRSEEPHRARPSARERQGPSTGHALVIRMRPSQAHP